MIVSLQVERFIDKWKMVAYVDIGIKALALDYWNLSEK